MTVKCNKFAYVVRGSFANKAILSRETQTERQMDTKTDGRFCIMICRFWTGLRQVACRQVGDKFQAIFGRKQVLTLNKTETTEIGHDRRTDFCEQSSSSIFLHTTFRR